MRLPTLLMTGAAALAAAACGQPAAGPTTTTTGAQTPTVQVGAATPAPSPALSLSPSPVASPVVNPAARPSPAAELRARFSLRDAAGTPVAIAELKQDEAAVQVEVEARNLPPGLHGVHIHAVGRCDPPDFASAGGHFNPDSRQHGAQNPQGPHAGDLPNLEVNANGRGEMEASTDRVTLAAGPTSLLDADGAALVIHAQADDERTDPTGDSGDRIACGIIELD